MMPLLSGLPARLLAAGLGLAALGALIGFGVFYQRPGASPPTSALPAPIIEDTPPLEPSAPPSTSSGQAARPYTGAPVAELKADPVFLAQVPEATYRQSLAELADLAVSLAANPLEPERWVRVARIKHYYNDDRGAAYAYEYVNLIAEGDPLPFYNVALIYAYNVKEPQRAVPKFEAAIALNPLNPSFYIGFADFWREVMGDLSMAESVLLRGWGKLAGDINLAVALGSLYRAMEHYPQAIRYYEQALSRQELGPAERASVSAEVERLKASVGE